MTAGALDGLRVLDLSNQLSGPYCAMLLGDLGADVLHLDHIGAQVAEQHRAVRTRELVREVEDAEAVEGAGGHDAESVLSAALTRQRRGCYRWWAPSLSEEALE